MPAGLRAVLAVQAVVAIVAGIVLFTSSPSVAADVWPWPLTDLTSKAIGTWLVGTGVTCAVVALLDDVACLPGWSVAQVVFGGALLLLGLVRFGGDVANELSLWLIVVFFASMIASGLAGIACRRGAAGVVRADRGGRQGVPVEIVMVGSLTDRRVLVIRRVAQPGVARDDPKGAHAWCKAWRRSGCRSTTWSARWGSTATRWD